MSPNSHLDPGTGQEFHPKVPPSKQLTTHGVCILFLFPLLFFCSVLYSTSELTIKSVQPALGVMVGNDAIPESKAQTLPAGSASRERTSKPNPDSSGTGEVGHDENDQEVAADAKTSTADPRMFAEPSHSNIVFEFLGAVSME
jgi:hypothetical protein